MKGTEINEIENDSQRSPLLEKKTKSSVYYSWKSFGIVSMSLLICSILAMAIFSTVRLTISPYPSCQLNPLTCEDQLRITDDLFSWSRVLVVVAHPDDAETAAGGTIASLVEQGTEVRYVILTSGNKGTNNRSMTPEELVVIRQKEQLAAAQVLGVTSVDFVGIDDGELLDTQEVRENLTRFIRKYRPEAVMTWNPTRRHSEYLYYLEHRDHRNAGQITLDCCYPTARDFLYFPHQLKEEGLEPWNVKRAYLFSWDWVTEFPSSNIIVDIGSTLSTKIKAMQEHKSQVGNDSKVEESLTSMAAALGKASYPKYAEWFTRVLFPN